VTVWRNGRAALSIVVVVGASAVMTLTSCGQPGGAIAGRVVQAGGIDLAAPDSAAPAVALHGAPVRVLRGGDVVATVRTDSQGRFNLRISPGTYLVRSPGTPAVTVVVSSGDTARATLRYPIL
jgi:hypothetical protein